MLVRSLKLNNYRNYSKALFEFDPHLNIIIGNNGTGKTNILESLVVVSNTKSFRTSLDTNLIKKDEEYARIEVLSDVGKFRVVINKNSKSLYFNDDIVKKTSEFIGKLNCVLFKPSDLELFNQSPKERRKLLDVEIGKVSSSYLSAVLKFNSLLKDKNNLLKQNDIDKILLSIIEDQMVPQIKTIINERERFFSIINRNISDLYYLISNDKKQIEVIYKKCAEKDDVKNMMEKSKEKDLYYHYATFGPHHEDYFFKMDGYELNSIASQGQKRMVLIAFKFALMNYIKEITGVTPVVLLDDILSELDKDNQERLLNILPADTQVIITNTDIDKIGIRNRYKLINLKEV